MTMEEREMVVVLDLGKIGRHNPREALEALVPADSGCGSVKIFFDVNTDLWGTYNHKSRKHLWKAVARHVSEAFGFLGGMPNLHSISIDLKFDCPRLAVADLIQTTRNSLRNLSLECARYWAPDQTGRDPIATAIHQHPCLERVTLHPHWIYPCGSLDRTIRAIAGCPKLKTFQYFTGADWKSLEESYGQFCGSTSLDQLNTAFRYSADGILQKMCEGLQRCQLKKVSLIFDRFSVQEEHMKELAQVLVTNRSITNLTISADFELFPILEALRTSNRSLRSLCFLLPMIPRAELNGAVEASVVSMLKENNVLCQLEARDHLRDDIFHKWTDTVIPFYLCLNRTGVRPLCDEGSCCREAFVEAIQDHSDDCNDEEFVCGMIFYCLSKCPDLLPSVGCSCVLGDDPSALLSRPKKRPKIH